MIRLQDIADMAGVSRTTVSNVINGNTKRVSQETIDKITRILKEQNYVPHMGSVMLSGFLCGRADRNHTDRSRTERLFRHAYRWGKN